MNPKQDPNTPKYNTTSGLLTDYGKSLGLKEVNSAITGADLAPQPKMKLPEPKATQPADFNLPETMSETDKEIAKIKAQKSTSESEISTLFQDIGLTKGKEAQYVTDAGGDKAEKDYNKYKADLLTEQTANRRAIERLQKNNPRGLFGGGLEQEVSRLERESLSKQADIAILGNAAKGDFDTALSIAKRKVESELAPLQAQLDAKKFVYENNKDLFSKAELSTLDTLIKADERKITNEADRLEKGNEMIINALSQGAGQSTTEKAKQLLANGGSVVEVATSLGKYAGDFLGNEIKRASLAKTNAEINKIASEIKSLNTPIDTNGLPNTTTGFVTKLMASAKNEKDLDASERQSLSKARTVIGQLDSLQTNIAGQNKTGFIKGRVNNFMESVGLDADVGTINAQLQAVVPNLARGTYGEVGVLTDNDIANYRKTLPRLDRPADQNDAVLALTLKTVLNSIENTLASAANSNVNVSGWTQDYVKIKNQINTIEDRIGVSKEAVNALILEDKTLVEPIKEMYQQGLTDGEILEALNAR